MSPLESPTLVRSPAVAGMFYPEDAAELRRLVESFLHAEERQTPEHFKAYVLPHAGYVYSGSVAGMGYCHLRAERETVRRIVLLGPSHRMAFQGLACSRHASFATPLGRVPVDRAAIESIGDLPQVISLDRAHELEHSLEVHLPFLQMVLGDFKLVPLVVGQATEEEVAEVLERLWGGEETRILISSDLSHYHDYDTACALDGETARRMETLRPVRTDQACGAVPVNGLLHAARGRRLPVRVLGVCNSGDTAGSRDRVVGYGAFGFRDPGGSKNPRLRKSRGWRAIDACPDAAYSAVGTLVLAGGVDCSGRALSN